jgi:hypothetical protein
MVVGTVDFWTSITSSFIGIYFTSLVPCWYVTQLSVRTKILPFVPYVFPRSEIGISSRTERSLHCNPLHLSFVISAHFSGNRFCSKYWSCFSIFRCKINQIIVAAARYCMYPNGSQPIPDHCPLEPQSPSAWYPRDESDNPAVEYQSQ